MDYSFYKVLHLLGVIFVFFSIGGLTLRAMDDGDRGKTRARRLAGLTHAVALLVVLVSGFGLLAKLELGFPAWAIGKMVIWLLLGVSIAFVRRKPGWDRMLWLVIPLLGGLAAYLVVVQPG